MGAYRAPDLYGYILINVRKICVNQCKSVSKKRPGDTDFTDYDVVISVSSARSLVFFQ